MMVIAGNLSDSKNNGNYFQSEDGKTGLWFGTIDDLWKFGKPTRGGRRKRIFSITNAGLAMLRSMKEARTDLWKLIPRLNYDLG